MTGKEGRHAKNVQIQPVLYDLDGVKTNSSAFPCKTGFLQPGLHPCEQTPRLLRLQAPALAPSFPSHQAQMIFSA